MKEKFPLSKLRRLLKLWMTPLYEGSLLILPILVSNATAVDEVEHNILELASKQSTTSNEATSRDKGEPDAIIVYSTSSGLAPLRYAQPTMITKDQVQDMMGQAMDSFVERQSQENE